MHFLRQETGRYLCSSKYLLTFVQLPSKRTSPRRLLTATIWCANAAFGWNTAYDILLELNIFDVFVYRAAKRSKPADGRMETHQRRAGAPT